MSTGCTAATLYSASISCRSRAWVAGLQLTYTMRFGAAFRMTFYYVWVHSGTWWVGDDDVRSTVLCDEIVGQDILHVACIEEGVLDVVHLRIHLGILYGLWHILDTDYLFAL